MVPMMDYRPVDGQLAVATHGNGVFTTQVSDFKGTDSSGPEDEAFRVLEAYPNPFNEETTIRFEIPENGEVRINIYSLGGDRIATLLWAPQLAGENVVTWGGTNAGGAPLVNGIYPYTIEFQGEVRAGKLLLRR